MRAAGQGSSWVRPRCKAQDRVGDLPRPFVSLYLTVIEAETALRARPSTVVISALRSVDAQEVNIQHRQPVRFTGIAGAPGSLIYLVRCVHGPRGHDQWPSARCSRTD